MYPYIRFSNCVPMYWFIVWVVIIKAVTSASSYTQNTEPVTDIFSFKENGSFVDNVVMSGDKTLLLTRIDVPEVWSVNLQTGSGTLVHSFAGGSSEITSCFGITKISPNVFTVVAGKFDLSKFAAQKGSFGIWKFDFSPRDDTTATKGITWLYQQQRDKEKNLNSAPVVTKIADIPEAVALGASTLFKTRTSRFLLISDSPEGIIWKLDLDTGKHAIAFKDDSMLPVPNGPPMGVNGIKVYNGYLYYVNVSKKEFRRVAIDRTASGSGPFELVSSEVTPDNFDIASDGTAYFATNTENTIVKLTRQGEVIQIAGNKNSTTLPGPTCCVLDREEETLYIGTNGGLTGPVNGVYKEPGKIAAISV
ncbi:hypothetical protein FE257_000214 [Aspergillus nanangensis]|uniref:SMP-30/Gluconolactonase/LRE-like region domain-containing protein n=1 Tax=Aspergillus nanangensis TaxID=2582783 RepID=A0AAD4CYY6_ASPNN|nr:hypothetical protein FE257_000214 [Aspergillus nanangensis]